MMHELDGDDGVLRDENRRACLHDIVQFVEFKKSLKHGHLTEDVLKEIPRQLCDYMKAVNYVPYAVS